MVNVFPGASCTIWMPLPLFAPSISLRVSSITWGTWLDSYRTSIRIYTPFLPWGAAPGLLSNFTPDEVESDRVSSEFLGLTRPQIGEHQTVQGQVQLFLPREAGLAPHPDIISTLLPVDLGQLPGELVQAIAFTGI